MQGSKFVFGRKGEAPVKHVGRAVFFACLTALLLLGMRQLVVAPEAASAESSPAPPVCPAVMAALPAPENASQSAPAAQETVQRPAALPVHQPMPVLTRADGCGWLITGRNYVRTVYIAFHLEGSAG